MRGRIITTLALVTACVLSAAAQTQAPELDPVKPAEHPALPTVTFSYEFPGAIPGHWSLSLESTGRAAYWSDSPAEENQAYQSAGKTATDEPYVERFTI